MRWVGALALLVLAAPLVWADDDTEGVDFIQYEGEAETKPGTTPWKFIGSHCFDNNGEGILRWRVNFDTGSLIPLTNATLVLYDDQDSSFPKVWDKANSMSCDDLLSFRRNKAPIVIPYKMGETWGTERFIDHNSGHQWFVVVAWCSSKAAEEKGMKFSYTLEFANTNNTAPSFELNDVPAPVAIYAVLMIIGLGLFGFSTIFRTKKLGGELLASHVHRLAAVAFLCYFIANICIWVFSGQHQPSGLSGFLFFQGFQHMLMFWILLSIAVSNKADRSFIERILGDVLFGFAFLYFIFWFVMGFEEPFPGVPGATVYSNGLSITASLFRTFISLIWGYLYYLSWTASKHQGGGGIFGLVFGALVMVFFWGPIITLWAEYGRMFSCNPPSLLSNTWVNSIFDGVAMIILVLVTDINWSAYLHSSVNVVAPSILNMLNPHSWDGTWDVNGGGAGGMSYGHLGTDATSTGTAGVMVDDEDTGTEIPEQGGAGSGGDHKSYGTL